MSAMMYDPPQKELAKLVKKKGEKHLYDEENAMSYYVWTIEDLVIIYLENPLKEYTLSGKFAFALENLDIDGQEDYYWDDDSVQVWKIMVKPKTAAANKIFWKY